MTDEITIKSFPLTVKVNIEQLNCLFVIFVATQ